MSLAACSAVGAVAVAVALAGPTATLATAIVGSVILVFVAAFGGKAVFRVTSAALVVSGMCLGYGFSNVGLASSLPVPAADALLGILGVYVFGRGDSGWTRSAAGRFGIGYAAVAAVRLLFDVSTWHNAAVRDFTTAFELLAFPVGYSYVRWFGVASLRGLLNVSSVLMAVVLTLQPARGAIAALGPTVGLQQPVPLLGSYSWPAAGALALYLVVCRPFGATSALVAAAYMPGFLVTQSRGLFLFTILGGLVSYWAATREIRISLRRTGARAAAIAAVLGAAVLLVGPTGRLGGTTLSFLTSEAATLAGGSGPGAGSIATRADFTRTTLHIMATHPYAWAVGVGLGPDLTGGFVATGSTIPVRQPHNDYLGAFARLGIGGFVAFVGLLSAFGVSALRSRRVVAGLDVALFVWAPGALILYTGIAATEPLFSYSYATIPLFFTFGALTAMGPETRTRPHAGGDNVPGSS